MSNTISKLSYLAGVTRFRRISEKLYLDGDKIYQEAGIQFKASWFPVYYILALAESPLTIMQITEQIDFSHITVKNVLRELEQEDYVTIITNSADKRSKLVSLSIKGQKLIYRLKPLWLSVSTALKQIFITGHPDFMNILNRIDRQIEMKPIHKMVAQPLHEPVIVVDYKPGLDKHFYELAGPWLTGDANGILEEKDGITLQRPDVEHFMDGGFLFFARYKGEIVGFVALTRMNDETFELARLYVNPNCLNLVVETKLIERCISRCMENEAIELWLQLTPNMPESDELYNNLGFSEKEPPAQMLVQEGTKSVKCLELGPAEIIEPGILI
jgi:DNA-binding MarR family transcriptional regulator/N-acetylglutamate synthase-like GNAT family acetyltransferase